LTVPSTDPECLAEIGEEPPLCTLERVIAAAPVAANPNQLLLTEPLPVACFTAGTVAYNVRAGGQFLAILEGTRVVRAGPGDRIGPGGPPVAPGRSLAPDAALLFDIRADLDPRLGEPACARYDADTGLEPPLVRDPEVEPAFEI